MTEPEMAADFFKHAKLVSLLTLVSRVLGLLRETVMAAAFGTTDLAVAFNVAFRIPNLFRRLFGEGAMTAAFVPVFTGLIENKDEKGAERLAQAVATLLLVVLAAITVVGEAVILLLSFRESPAPRYQLTLMLAAIMLPFVMSVCLIGFLQSILNVRGHFFVPALAPIVLNLFNIAAAAACYFLIPDHVLGIKIVALSVLAAGVVQLLIYIPPLRRHGFRFGAVWDLTSPHLRQIMRLMLPMVIGLGIVQINNFMDQVIAEGFSQPEVSLTAAAEPGQPQAVLTHFNLLGRQTEYPLQQGAVTIMYQAERLYELPIGLFTIALGTTIFPTLARHAQRRDNKGLAETLNRGLRLSTFIGLPCTIGMLVVATPLVRVILEHGKWRPESSVRVAEVVCVYVFGLVVFSALHLLTRAFFALQETRLPVVTSAIAAVANFVLNLTLIWFLGIRGLALATVLTATAQMVAQVILLRRRIGPLGLRRLLRTFGQTLAASLVMGLAAWGAMQAVELAGVNVADPTGGAVLALAAAIIAGVAAFALAAWALKIEEFHDLLNRRRPTPAA